jgi:hypothetical protein
VVRRPLAGVVTLVAAASAGACNTGFEKQSIVIDLRLLAIRTEPAEVVVDVDPADLGSIEVPPVTVTALVADPLGRALSYTMTACGETFSLRCDDPEIEVRVPVA